MKTRLACYLLLGAISPLVLVAEQAAQPPCAASPKGTTQTPAGMCIDGVLFKDMLARLAVLESHAVSQTNPQGKPVH